MMLLKAKFFEVEVRITMGIASDQVLPETRSFTDPEFEERGRSLRPQAKGNEAA